MDSGAKQPAQRAPYEISVFGSGTFRVTDTKTGRAVFYGPQSVAEKWLKELSGAYVQGVEHAIGKMQDAQLDRFERGARSDRGEVLNGRNPRGDARLLGDLSACEDVADPRSAPLVSLKQGDYRQDAERQRTTLECVQLGGGPYPLCQCYVCFSARQPKAVQG